MYGHGKKSVKREVSLAAWTGYLLILTFSHPRGDQIHSESGKTPFSEKNLSVRIYGFLRKLEMPF